MDYRDRRNTITNRYDFSGKVIASYQRLYIPDHVQGGSQTTTLLTKMEYDFAGRLLKIRKKINDGTIDRIIAENSYDELGQVKSKKLAPEYNSNAGLEALNYEYNIRGWLKSINKDYADAANNTNWFGQILSYDHGFSSQQHNGNISGLQWRSKGDGDQRAYGFTYDKVNRLLSGDFTQYTGSAWNTSAGLDFTNNNISYDANGNILTMNHKGWKLGGSVTIDNLAYTYNSNSNKLLKVSDGITSNNKMGDFFDGTNGSNNDYTYDVNGNLITDQNKDIKDNTYQGIEYNHLNLPVKIRVQGKGTIEYNYDATGLKLRKIVTEGSLKTVTTYIAGFVYQFRTTGNIEDGIDSLQYIGHEEGRIRPVASDFVYDYFVKDHLGNIRMTLTEEQKTDAYPDATMETANEAIEETYYSNMDESRVDPPSGYPANTPTGNAKVAKVKGVAPNDATVRVGPSILLKVMSGDKFHVKVNSWWDEGRDTPGTPTNPLNDLLNLIGTSAGGITGGHPSVSEIQNSTELSNAVTGFLNSQSSYNSARPKAFLNWVLLDERFNYVAASSGFDQVGASLAYTTHSFTDLPISKNGYLYIYVSNATPNMDVFFDNLQITHIRGPLLEENSYYPFGLVQQGISSKALAFGDPENKEKTFQGQRFDDDLGVNWVQFKWRNHDPQIGRFIEIDPLSDTYVYNSTYAFSENKVISFVELEGLETAKPKEDDFYDFLEKLYRAGREQDRIASKEWKKNNSFISATAAITKGDAATIGLKATVGGVKVEASTAGEEYDVIGVRDNKAVVGGTELSTGESVKRDGESFSISIGPGKATELGFSDIKETRSIQGTPLGQTETETISAYNVQVGAGKDQSGKPINTVGVEIMGVKIAFIVGIELSLKINSNPYKHKMRPPIERYGKVDNAQHKLKVAPKL